MKRLTISSLMVFALSVVFLCSMLIPASATIITYSNRADWESQVGSYLTENFDDAELNDGIIINSGGGGTVDSSDNNLFEDAVNTYQTTISFTPELLAWGGYFDLGPGEAGEGINIHLLSGGTEVGQASVLNTVVVGSSEQDMVQYLPYVGFFGFRSTIPFDQIELAGAGQENFSSETYTLDDMQYAPIPEPATMLLLGTGLVGLAGFGRKKFSKKMRSS